MGDLSVFFSRGVVGSLIVLHAPPILAANTGLAELSDKSVVEALRKELHRYICCIVSATMLLVAESVRLLHLMVFEET